ncbi:MAG: hybrid sensor histidine kinase/response regulator [Verrucomicrobiota bacterium]
MELARQQLPDLILTDISMPGMGGEDVLREIRRDPQLGSKQVVLMTGDPSVVTPRRGMEEGADDFLVKPVATGDLLRCVAARLKRAQTHWRVEDSALSQLQPPLHATLPHEFFTPLAGIIGVTDVLQSGLALSPEDVQELHRDIRISALRLHRTLRNYLFILELENAPAPKQPAPLPVAALEQTVDVAIRETAERNGRMDDLAVRVDEDAVLVHPRDLGLIVEELVDNACKFSRTGMPIIVRLVGGVLTVNDGGRGMTPEEISQVGAFCQFDRKKHEQQGLGLGLFLARMLAAQNGASLAIQSEPGQGTEVRVTFLTSSPAVPGPERAHENTVAHSSS